MRSDWNGTEPVEWRMRNLEADSDSEMPVNIQGYYNSKSFHIMEL